VLEAAAACVPILSTPVGLAADILHPRCLFKSVDDAIEKVFETAEHGYPLEYIKQHAETVVLNHTPEAVALRLTELYKDVGTKLSIQVLPNRYEVDEQVQHQAETRWTVPVKRALARILRQDKPGIGICMCLWHNFHKPPYGGGNQFMMALGRGLAELGVKVVNNRIDDRVDVHVCNAIWFNPVLLEKLASDRRCRVIHRLDGIVHLARGNLDKSIDDYAYDFNKRFATATVMQSAWCLTQALGLGYQPIRPVIIHNSCDPSVFYRLNTPHSSKRIRLIATSWSDNPSKGSGLYKILEQHLDWTKFDFTFVGRTKETFTHIRHVQPMDSRNLAHMLRQHDIYITASRNEACSNALIEALACGLPALYLNDGGNPEVVGYGGLPFENENDMLDQLLKLADSRDAFRQCISISSLRDVAMRYLDLAKQVIKL
jgi:glycosyltransferase involved in cell wall biosynthesis